MNKGTLSTAEGYILLFAGLGVEGGGLADRHEGPAGERRGRGRLVPRNGLWLHQMASTAWPGQIPEGALLPLLISANQAHGPNKMA